MRNFAKDKKKAIKFIQGDEKEDNQPSISISNSYSTSNLFTEQSFIFGNVLRFEESGKVFLMGKDRWKELKTDKEIKEGIRKWLKTAGMI